MIVRKAILNKTRSIVNATRLQYKRLKWSQDNGPHSVVYVCCLYTKSYWKINLKVVQFFIDWYIFV